MRVYDLRVMVCNCPRFIVLTFAVLSCELESMRVYDLRVMVCNCPRFVVLTFAVLSCELV